MKERSPRIISYPYNESSYCPPHIPHHNESWYCPHYRTSMRSCEECGRNVTDKPPEQQDPSVFDLQICRCGLHACALLAMPGLDMKEGKIVPIPVKK